jgi:hypothetical protein
MIERFAVFVVSVLLMALLVEHIAAGTFGPAFRQGFFAFFGIL